MQSLRPGPDSIRLSMHDAQILAEPGEVMGLPATVTGTRYELTPETIEPAQSKFTARLRKQKGFLEEITLLYLNGREVHSSSLSESAEHAEAHNRGFYPEVAEMLASVIDGMPRIRTYQVARKSRAIS